MTVPAFNTVAWFQVGTDAPDEARRFYGEMFGWTISADPDIDGYDLINYPGGEAPVGGVQHNSDASDNHAIFIVLVEDVDAMCAETERLGGKIAVPPASAPTGLRFAYLDDPSGNRFGVFTPPM